MKTFEGMCRQSSATPPPVPSYPTGVIKYGHHSKIAIRIARRSALATGQLTAIRRNDKHCKKTTPGAALWLQLASTEGHAPVYKWDAAMSGCSLQKASRISVALVTVCRKEGLRNSSSVGLRGTNTVPAFST